MKNAMWVIVGTLLMAGCGNSGGSGETSSSGSTSDLKGTITIDGSSTVYPISQAVAEGFMDANPGVNVTVSESGTGGGFKKFVNGELDVAGASRPIEPEEVEAATKNGIDFVELPVAFDGLSVVVHPSNTWADTLTVAELKAMWSPDSKINNWKDVRPGFPDLPIKLYGAGTASGTFEYFTEAIVGVKKSSRSTYQASENDNTLVQGVAGDKGALGYFGFAYYVENRDKLKIVKIDNGTGGVEPNETTINDGTYAPLSRPLFVYINRKSIDRPEVKAFAKFLLSAEGRPFIKTTGYIELPARAYELANAHVDEMKTGTRFQGTQVGLKIEDVLQKDGS